MAWQASSEAGEDALTELRIILDETLDRVRTEIFGAEHAAAEHPDSPGEGDDQGKRAVEPPAGTSSTGNTGDTTS